jgi:thioredoxin reductase (NADPH)
MEMLRTDVAVVGAGPIGLELAVALKRAGVDYRQFDGKQIGHTISWFAPGTRFFSSNERIAIAGVPLQTPDQGKATREEYLAYLRGVVQQFDLKFNTYEPVVGIERHEGEFFLTSRPRGGERVWRAKRVVLATGGTDVPRRLGIPGEDLPHVSPYFREPHAYFRRKLLIVGGKNSAVEAALRCHHAGAQVSLSYRRGELGAKSIKYWLLPEINDLIRTGRIAAYFNTMPVEITPTHVKLARWSGESHAVKRAGIGDDGANCSAADLAALNAQPQTLEVESDFVLLLIGYAQDNALLRRAGVELRGECQAPVFDERTMESNVPGLYVAGTAVAGTQDRYRVFIENCHVHVDRIVAALTGAAAPQRVEPIALPES